MIRYVYQRHQLCPFNLSSPRGTVSHVINFKSHEASSCVSSGSEGWTGRAALSRRPRVFLRASLPELGEIQGSQASPALLLLPASLWFLRLRRTDRCPLVVTGLNTSSKLKSDCQGARSKGAVPSSSWLPELSLLLFSWLAAWSPCPLPSTSWICGCSSICSSCSCRTGLSVELILACLAFLCVTSAGTFKVQLSSSPEGEQAFSPARHPDSDTVLSCLADAGTSESMTAPCSGSVCVTAVSPDASRLLVAWSSQCSSVFPSAWSWGSSLSTLQWATLTFLFSFLPLTLCFGSLLPFPVVFSVLEFGYVTEGFSKACVTVRSPVTWVSLSISWFKRVSGFEAVGRNERHTDDYILNYSKSWTDHNYFPS